MSLRGGFRGSDHIHSWGQRGRDGYYLRFSRITKAVVTPHFVSLRGGFRGSDHIHSGGQRGRVLPQIIRDYIGSRQIKQEMLPKLPILASLKKENKKIKKYI